MRLSTRLDLGPCKISDASVSFNISIDLNINIIILDLVVWIKPENYHLLLNSFMLHFTIQEMMSASPESTGSNREDIIVKTSCNTVVNILHLVFHC